MKDLVDFIPKNLALPVPCRPPSSPRCRGVFRVSVLIMKGPYQGALSPII